MKIVTQFYTRGMIFLSFVLISFLLVGEHSTRAISFKEKPLSAFDKKGQPKGEIKFITLNMENGRLHDQEKYLFWELLK